MQKKANDDYNNLIDLLNITATIICPKLHIQFYHSSNQPFIVIGDWFISKHIPIEFRELAETGNSKEFYKFVKVQIENSLIEMRGFIDKELNKLKEKK